MTQNSESVREAEQREVNPELAVHVFSHDKHYRALIRWMKSRKMTEHDLADLFAEGSTVAREIWWLYGAAGRPNHSEKYDQQRIKAATLKLAEEAQQQAGEIQNYQEWTWSNVAAWLREKAR